MKRAPQKYEIQFYLDIIQIKIGEKTLINALDILEIDSFIKEKVHKKRFKRLINISECCQIDDEAKKTLTNQKSRSKVMVQAIIVGSNTNQDVLDFFEDMGSRKLPTKIFVNERHAKTWLSTFEVRN